MKKTITIAIMSMLVAGLMLTSCDRDASIKIDPETLYIGLDGGTPVDFNIYTEGEWTLSTTQDWITVTPASGNGNGTVSVIVDPSDEERGTRVTINGENGTASVTVYQTNDDNFAYRPWPPLPPVL